ncbi:family 20 glycosylhydrolase [Schaalia sp. 19OD2882]|uniref:family 20 glycosylhydrolase n=1 Tax=Schaalia sp. 19OD2882 TaxID=2794089 RepID=UPI001C1ED61C|nr:family 20 glycosylhydrolase [Schaalia sp. 19OD2882]QWW19059.1 family 20 glycosylhydrolase [Schaalia sp. 19OD2882]
MPISRPAHRCASVFLALFALVVSMIVPIAPAFADPASPSPDAAAQLRGKGLSRVVPALRSIEPVSGVAPWILRAGARVLVPEGHDGLRSDAELFVDELRTALSAPDVSAVQGAASEARPGDIVLAVDPSLDVPSEEGYRIDVKETVTITGKSRVGAYWGTRSLLQSISASGGAEAAVVTDWPDVVERSFHIDAARKFYSKDFFLRLIPELSWRKVNVLQYHFSENEGFRLTSETHPEIVSDEHLTKDDLRELIALAARYHIEVIPALDMPGHLRHALAKHPEWRLGNTDEARKGLDYSKKEARDFVKELLTEYAPLFPGDKWHLGADEFIDFARAEYTYPQLKKYAEQATGNPNATVADGFTTFINEMIGHLETLGKTDVRVWNDGFYRSDNKQSVELSKSATIDYWTAWDAKMAPVTTFVDKGYRLVNFNDKYMYYVLYYPNGAYHNRPKPDVVYNEFTAGTFPTNHQHTQYQWPRPYPQWLRGASFAIWSDNAPMETEEQVAQNSRPLVDAFAARTWNADDNRDHATFTSDMSAVGPALVAPPKQDLTVSAALGADPGAGEVSAGSELSYTASATNTSAIEVKSTVTIDSSATAKGLKADQVSVKVVDSAGNAPQAPSRNVALASEGATVKASGTETLWNGQPSQFTPDNVIDGSTAADSRWSSNYADDAWIQVDLARPMVLDKVKLSWQEACAPTYSVSVLKESGQWVSLGERSYTCPTGKTAVGLDEIPVTTDDPVSALKVQATSRRSFNGTKYGVSLWEIEALTPGGPAAIPAPSVQAGVITWTGDLAAGNRVDLMWKGAAPDTAGAQLPVSMKVRVTQAINEGAASAEITHSVANTPAPPAKPTLSLDKDTVRPGDTVVLTGTGFAPKAKLTVDLHSDPVRLAEPVADADGKFTATLTIPTSTKPGAHTLVVTDRAAQVSAEAKLTLTQAPGASPDPKQPGGKPGASTPGTKPTDKNLALTGAPVSMVVVALLALVVPGVAFTVAARRRMK